MDFNLKFSVIASKFKSLLTTDGRTDSALNFLERYLITTPSGFNNKISSVFLSIGPICCNSIKSILFLIKSVHSINYNNFAMLGNNFAQSTVSVFLS